MASTNINVRTDTLLKAKAQAVLESVGMDMSTAINVFLHQIVNKNGIPFEIAAPEKKTIKFGEY
jgi:DNA-damage-inducible protein J